MAKAIINGIEINKFVVDGGGGGELATDWSKLNYKVRPPVIDDAYNYALNIYNNWDASITDRSGAFKDDKNMVYFPAVDLSNVKNMQDMFANSLLSILPANLYTPNVINMQWTFGNCTGIQSLDLSNWDTSNVANLSWCFSGCTNLKTLEVSTLNTSAVTTLYQTFSNCNSLQSLDVSNWNTSKVTTMENTFYNCTNLQTLDVSNWNTSKVTTMKQMFHNCNSLQTLDVSNWNTSKVTTMNQLFCGLSNISTLDVSMLNVEKVTNMGNIFAYCSNLISLNVGNWNSTAVTEFCESIQGPFAECLKLKKVDGYIDFSSAKRITYNNNYGWNKTSELRKIEFRNIGKNSALTQFYMVGGNNGLSKWGEDTEEIPDARQSMINTLITYSFDRASAGYSKCTISLHANAKARLTEDEIAQITAKGYTIA